MNKRNIVMQTKGRAFIEKCKNNYNVCIGSPSNSCCISYWYNLDEYDLAVQHYNELINC